MKPLLLVDVDGVLNPLGRPTPDFRRYECTLGAEVYTVHLNAWHGRRLMELAVRTGSELVWATTWEDDANEWIGPRLGLPALPVIHVRRDRDSELGEMFKTPFVAEYVKGRPFVWFDDYVWPADQRYLRDHPDVGEFLLVHVEPKTGLTRKHFELAAEWLTLSGFSQGR
ncbi:HAD domain-containing protein [Nonomuraea sp. NBC_01738]|uniref:HAD domain-containing protein n=1 Tax=Nonomuraea sp. NBC_01738 TaxID=2976003 RepID=UPI002E110C59|nr:HAD domain-containing protein [Nonomuraea sp. NBC_01738]